MTGGGGEAISIWSLFKAEKWREMEVEEGAISTWSSCVFHGLKFAP